MYAAAIFLPLVAAVVAGFERRHDPGLAKRLWYPATKRPGSKATYPKAGRTTFGYLPAMARSAAIPDKLDEATLPGSMREGILRFWLKDEQGVYWLGTNVGVFMVAEAGKSTFRQFDFLKNISIRSIIEDEAGNLLIGTYGGLFKYDPDRGNLLKMPKIKTVLD